MRMQQQNLLTTTTPTTRSPLFSLMTLFNWILFKSNLRLLQYPSNRLTQIHHPWLLVLVLVPLLLRGSVSNALSATPESNASSKSTTQQLSLGSNNDFQAWYEELRISPDGLLQVTLILRSSQRGWPTLLYKGLTPWPRKTVSLKRRTRNTRRRKRRYNWVPDPEAEWWNPSVFGFALTICDA
jgi:hypothetical protein